MEPETQEIKLEEYMFLGERINYENNNIEIDSHLLPEDHYTASNIKSEETDDTVVFESNQRIIDLTESPNDDDVENILNSNHDSAASNLSFQPTQDVLPESPDYINEMQALIANCISDTSREKSHKILIEMENEIKRIKSTIPDCNAGSQEINPIPDAITPSRQTIDISGYHDNGSCYPMSEGHSEPLEYIGICGVLAGNENSNESIDERNTKTLINIRRDIENITSKVTNFSTLLANDTRTSDTVKSEAINLNKSGEELLSSLKSMILKVHNASGNAKPINETVVNPNIDRVVENKDDEDKLKKRWLASSSEDMFSSDESVNEKCSVVRRKKRLRISSSSDEVSLRKIGRKKNVLLDSSDDDMIEKSVNSPAKLRKVESVDSGKSNSGELEDVDMSNYLLPNDVPKMLNDVNDKNESMVESEQKDFSSFNGQESKLPITNQTNIEFDAGNQDEIAKDVVNEDEEEGDESDTDEEVERLINLATIATERTNAKPLFRKKSTTKRKPKAKDDILNNLTYSSQEIDSECSSLEDFTTEEQYVLQLAKEQCLEDSSGDSDVDSDSEGSECASSIDEVSNGSTVSKLESFLKKEPVNKEEKDSVGNTAQFLVDDDADEIDVAKIRTKVEPKLEPELNIIEQPTLDIFELSDEDQNSDCDEATKQRKALEEKEKWKLKKAAFNKTLCENLDESEKTISIIESDDSDCELVDVSMFETKGPAEDLLKVLQIKNNRDLIKDIECVSLSSDSDLEIDEEMKEEEMKEEEIEVKKIPKSRPILRDDQLAGETKQAQREENDRVKRLEKKTEKLTQIVETQTVQLSQSNDESDLVLDFDTERNCAISVHPEIVKNLKEHQVC